MNNTFKYLVSLFQKLPGVGPRQSARFVLALLNREQSELAELGNAIIKLKQSVSFCSECYNLTENGLCSICTNPRRNAGQLMIVEKVTDLNAIERTGLFNGHYHVLGGAINPVEGVNPEHLRIAELQNRLAGLQKLHPTVELIAATNPSTAGDTTLLYLRQIFEKKDGINFTRLGRGLASGSHLEYIDELTLKHALEQRK